MTVIRERGDYDTSRDDRETDSDDRYEREHDREDVDRDEQDRIEMADGDHDRDGGERKATVKVTEMIKTTMAQWRKDPTMTNSVKGVRLRAGIIIFW